MSASVSTYVANSESLRAFDDVPRAFWRAVTVDQLRGMISIGRLTLPERQHLCSLLARQGDTPRDMDVSFPADVLAWLGAPENKAAYATHLAELLARLQTGKPAALGRQAHGS